jgi:hypothetical protein
MASDTSTALQVKTYKIKEPPHHHHQEAGAIFATNQNGLPAMRPKLQCNRSIDWQRAFRSLDTSAYWYFHSRTIHQRHQLGIKVDVPAPRTRDVKAKKRMGISTTTLRMAQPVPFIMRPCSSTLPVADCACLVPRPRRDAVGPPDEPPFQPLEPLRAARNILSTELAAPTM